MRAAQAALPKAQVRNRVADISAVGRPPAAAAALAAELGVSHIPDGIVIAGTPIGMNAFVVSVLAERASDVVAQVDRLEALPFGAQSKWCILRLSLAHRIAHLCRTVKWERLD